MIMLVLDVLALSACHVGGPDHPKSQSHHFRHHAAADFGAAVGCGHRQFSLLEAISNSAQRDNRIWELFLAIYLTTGIAVSIYFWSRGMAAIGGVSAKSVVEVYALAFDLEYGGAPSPAAGETPPVIVS